MAIKISGRGPGLGEIPEWGAGIPNYGGYGFEHGLSSSVPSTLGSPTYGGSSPGGGVQFGGGDEGIRKNLPGNIWDWVKSNPLDAFAVALGALNAYGSYQQRKQANDIQQQYLNLSKEDRAGMQARWDENAHLREGFNTAMGGFQSMAAPDLTETFADPSNPFYKPPSALGRHINGGSPALAPTTSPQPPQEMAPGPFGPVPAGSDLAKAFENPAARANENLFERYKREREAAERARAAGGV